MIRWIIFGSVLCFLAAASPADLCAQFNPNANRVNPYGWGLDPRVRRANREMAVAIVGPGARDFVETQGDEAVAAIFACSKPVAVKLAQFHASGELGKLIRPRDLLRVIAQPGHGNDVALWAIHHAGELTDTDCFDAYLMSPLEYALGLKPLEAGAAEARARRLNQVVNAPPPGPPPLSDGQKLGIAGIFCVLFVIGVLWWRGKQASVC
jgi:hypothetical protein